MAKVVIDLSMSLDGFITGPNPTLDNGFGVGGERLHEWLFEGTEPVRDNEFFKPLEASREVVEHMVERTGAMLIGRNLYDIVNGWDGSHPIKGVPVFVLTHQAPDTIPQGTSPITIVTDGLESAVQQAKAAAGEKEVVVHGASMTHQLLDAGLADELMIHIVPILLGDGTRLFEHLSTAPINLEIVTTVEAPRVTHLRYRVMK
jgi:dihydrofolate reductase